MAVVYAFMLKLAMIVLLCLRTPQPISTSRFCGFIHVLVVMSTFLLHVIILADLPYDVRLLSSLTVFLMLLMC